MSKVSDRSQDGSNISTSVRTSASHEQTVLFEKSLGKIAGTVQSTALVNAISQRLDARETKPIAVYELRIALTRDEIEDKVPSETAEVSRIKSTMASLLKQYHNKADALAVIDVSGAPAPFSVEKIDDLLFVEGDFFDKIHNQKLIHAP